MSRPGTVPSAEPRVPRADRTVHRRSAPVPLRVVARRLTPEEADRLAVSRRAAPVVGPVAALEPPPLPAPTIVGLRPTGDRPLPVLDRRTRRRPFARLLALVHGRRRVESCGRHRPDTTPSQGWSMFAPQRRARRRFGVRR